MIPSNPSNSKPFIFRFFDSLGIAHLCAALNHTHSQSEVDGLTTALAGKASSSDMTTALAGKMDKMTVDEVPTSGSNNLVKSGGVFSALLNKVSKIIASQSTSEKSAYVETEIDGDDGVIHLGVKSEGEEEQIVDIDHNNFANLIRALHNPDSTPTESSDNLVTSGGVFSELAKKLSKVEVTDLDDLSEITDNGLYELCLNTSGTHTTSFEYFLMLVERSLPLITYTLISSTGYKKRTYNVSNGWVGDDWGEYVYATTEFKPDGIESLSPGGSAKVYTYISDLTGDGRIGIELEDHLLNNVYIEITPDNIANLARALHNPDSTPTESSDNLVTSGGVKAALPTFIHMADSDHQTLDISTLTPGVLYTVWYVRYDSESAYLNQIFTKGSSQKSIMFNCIDQTTHNPVLINQGDEFLVQIIYTADSPFFVTYLGMYE